MESQRARNIAEMAGICLNADVQVLLKLAIAAVLVFALLIAAGVAILAMQIAHPVFWYWLGGLSSALFLVAIVRTLIAPQPTRLSYAALAYFGLLVVYLQFVAPHVPEPYGYKIRTMPVPAATNQS
jgi:hypothetical protein